MKSNKKKKILLVSGITALTFMIMLGSAWALYKDDIDVKNTIVTGNLKLDSQTLGIAPSSTTVLADSSFQKTISVWQPGDIHTLKWKVKNTGNKSIVTRNTIYMYWDGTMHKNANYKDIIYLYPHNIADATIKNELLNKNPAHKINIGNYTDTVSINGTNVNCFKYTFFGDSLNGVGTGAETGDAKEVTYNSIYDDNSTTEDVPSFKLALSPYANALMVDKKLHVVVLTEALQYRNTEDATWTTISVQNIDL